jgi:hypothetical protein
MCNRNQLKDFCIEGEICIIINNISSFSVCSYLSVSVIKFVGSTILYRWALIGSTYSLFFKSNLDLSDSTLYPIPYLFPLNFHRAPMM